MKLLTKACGQRCPLHQPDGVLNGSRRKRFAESTKKKPPAFVAGGWCNTPARRAAHSRGPWAWSLTDGRARSRAS
jgi:hypothetical protein